MGDVDDNSVKEELGTCKHFLVDRYLENRRRRVCKFAMDTLDPRFLLENLDIAFASIKCTAKLILAFDFVLKTRRWEFWVLLSTRKFYPTGEVQTCGYYRRLHENQKATN